LDRTPALRGMFVVIRIVTRWVEDGYANRAVGINFL
jgi:hypothetical protein